MYLEASLTYFKHTNIDEVNVLLSKMNKTTCMFDPFHTRLLLDFSHLFIDVIVRIINLTSSTASLIEKVIAIRLVEHMRQNTIMEKNQSAYKAHHSTETALSIIMSCLILIEAMAHY